MDRRTIYFKIAFVFLTLAAGSILFSVYQFENAERCKSSTTVSRNCVTKAYMTIEEVTVKTIGGGTGPGGSPTEDLYGIVVKKGNSTETIWLKPFPEEFVATGKVETLSWNNHYIGVVVNSNVQYAYYWEPGFMKGAAYLWLVILALFYGVPFAFQKLATSKYKKQHPKEQLHTSFGGYLFTCVAGAMLFLAWADGLLRMGLLL